MKHGCALKRMCTEEELASLRLDAKMGARLDGAELGVVVLRAQVVHEGPRGDLGRPQLADALRAQRAQRRQALWVQDALRQLSGHIDILVPM